MRIPHTPWHWITVAAVLAIAMFTLGDAHGQSTGSNATFEGRPSMPGPQSGLGAQSGPPQGGISPQTMDDPRGGVVLQKPSGLDRAVPVKPADPGVLPRDPGVARPSNGELAPQRDRDSGVVRKDRDSGGVADQGRVGNKAKRATKRTIERARRGVGGVDS
jgi:hypothetical protein